MEFLPEEMFSKSAQSSYVPVKASDSRDDQKRSGLYQLPYFEVGKQKNRHPYATNDPNSFNSTPNVAEKTNNYSSGIDSYLTAYSIKSQNSPTKAFEIWSNTLQGSIKTFSEGLNRPADRKGGFGARTQYQLSLDTPNPGAEQQMEGISPELRKRLEQLDSEGAQEEVSFDGILLHEIPPSLRNEIQFYHSPVYLSFNACDLASLASMPLLPDLKFLELAENRISDKELVHLHKYQALERLSLDYNDIDGVQWAAQLAANLPKLCHLEVVGNPFTRSAKGYRNHFFEIFVSLQVLNCVFRNGDFVTYQDIRDFMQPTTAHGTTSIRDNSHYSEQLENQLLLPHPVKRVKASPTPVLSHCISDLAETGCRSMQNFDFLSEAPTLAGRNPFAVSLTDFNSLYNSHQSSASDTLPKRGRPESSDKTPHQFASLKYEIQKPSKTPIHFPPPPSKPNDGDSFI